MKKKLFLVLLGVFSLSVLVAKKENKSATKPNIIMILVDDMGYSDAGCFGGEVRTPNIDKLAERGLRFTQNYNTARCCPTRASLLTGLYSQQAGVANFTGRNNTETLGPAYRGELNDQCVTLAEMLKSTGYNTYMVGKWHVGRNVSPVKRGFDEFYGYTKGYAQDQWLPESYERLPEGRPLELDYNKNEFYATDVFNDYAIEFLKQAQSKDEPYFLYVAHSSPHFPLHAPAKTRDSYVETYMKGWDVLRKERYERQQKMGLITPAWKFTELSDVPSVKNQKQNPNWKDLSKERQTDLAYRMATFAAMIEHVDNGIGQIIKQLKKAGDLDNTLILFTSDNGACYEWDEFGFDKVDNTDPDDLAKNGKMKKFNITNIVHQGDLLDEVGQYGTWHSIGSAWSCLNNTPLRLYKHFNHEGGNCSPLIASWPEGIETPDRWVRTPIHVFDIMPTLCQLSGAKYPKQYNGEAITPMEGSSLVSFFEGKEASLKRTLYFDHFGASAIRKGDWKLVRPNKTINNGEWELYNLTEDRCETVNLIDKYPKKAKSLEEDWTDWAVRVKIEPYYKHLTKNRQ
jgi:arylsulfatase